MMDRDELRRILDSQGVCADAYSLQGGHEEDRLCLDEVHGSWIVYYVERGKRWNERSFETEDAACKYLTQLLLNHPSSSEVKFGEPGLA